MDRLASVLGFSFPAAASTSVGNHKEVASNSVPTAELIWTAWNNGSHLSSGGGYGLKVPIADRDAHFNRGWSTVVLEIPRQGGFEEIELNIAKPSFWNETCHELISQEIGRWLRSEGLAPWPPGQPPKIKVAILGERRFRVLAGER
jgi:hypothetical protein